MSGTIKAMIAALSALVVGAVWWGGSLDAQEAPEHNYIGVEACASRCHARDRTGNQMGQWQASAHASAYQALAGEQAQAIAAERGIENPQEAGECLQCHVTAYGVAAEHLAEGFDITQGVQCEACHGPGEDYSPMRVMRDVDAAVAAGLVVPDESVCTGCHNDQSPTFESFNFEEMYGQIAHPNPQSE